MGGAYEEETGRVLVGCTRRTEEEVMELTREVRAALDETIEAGKYFIAKKMADVEASLKAEREPM